MSLCRYKDSLGTPGKGFHKTRIPGTDTAAGDYILTLLLAWGISAISGAPLVLTTVVLFLVAFLLHKLFCVKTATTKHL